MEALFAQKEQQIQPLLASKFMVVIGSYAGNDDLVADKVAADVEFAKLFPNRWKEACTLNTSAKTVTASGAACDSRIIPYLYKDDVLVADTLYTFVASTGVFTFAATPASGTYKATFVRNVFGANVATPDSSFPNTTKDINAFGTNDPVYTTTTYQDTKHAVKVDGTFDVAKSRRKYAGAELEKMVYGDDWDETSAAENDLSRNSNPFFVACIWWNPDAEAGQLEVKTLIYYKCTLNKAIIPIPDGIDNPAKFEIDCVSQYCRTTNTLKSA